MHRLLKLTVIKRSLLIWIIGILTTFIIFYIAAFTHPEVWTQFGFRSPQTGWPVFFFIIFFNLLLIAFIVVGNIFVRFGSVTPGIVILFIQLIHIGWIAGTNSFMEPFASIASANLAFLRIGLWEITAYVLFCSATLDKSLYVSDTFPAKEWKETKTLKDIHFSNADKIVILIGCISLLLAATIEAFVG